MSADSPPQDNDDEIAAEVRETQFGDELQDSYITYAMSVIAGRSLPDARDGLKPVHRRILYAMDEMGVTSNTGHRKSSSIVGETMGNYHPHGDSAIYDTLVNMAQDFSQRYPLIDGQGNFGSIDGDPAAAMRYTEARMAPITEHLLEDIDADTVDFESNYDDRLQEPSVLPVAYPNLLANGTTGIAVGMSTKIPPHNLEELIDATTHLIRNPDASVTDLMEHMPGPDFPTGGKIVGRNGIKNAYQTGRGKIRMRANYHVDESDSGRDRIIITEVPYQQNKAKLIENIADDVREGKLDGIVDIRDESDREGIRVVIELKASANTDVVENNLLKSHFESTFGVIMLALVDGQPTVLSLKDALNQFIEHRREVVRRRSEHELGEQQDRAHILEGRLRALENAEDIVELIQDSADRDEAKTSLKTDYNFSQEQADHIVRMQLGSLTNLESDEIQEEYEDVQTRIDELQAILNSTDKLDEVVINEMKAVQDAHADDRRTQIIEDSGTVTDEDLIPEEDIVVVLSEDDYVKRMSTDQFDTQNRAGKGIIGTELKEGDSVSKVFTTHTHSTILCLTTHGQVYQVKGYEIPDFSRTARGKSAVNLLDLNDGEELAAVVDVESLDADQYVSMVTENGYAKRTEASEFQNILSTGIIAIKLRDDDTLADVEITTGDEDLIVGTQNGRAIRFAEDEVRAMGRTARGVQGMTLTDDDKVVGVVAVPGPEAETEGEEVSLFTITENGYGKRSVVSEYRQQSRNGKGVLDIKTDDRNGRVAAMKAVTSEDDLMIMSSAGKIMRVNAGDISAVSRNTKGVTVMTVEEGDSVVSVDVV